MPEKSKKNFIFTQAPIGWLGKTILQLWEGEPETHGGNLIGSISIRDERLEDITRCLQEGGFEYRSDSRDDKADRSS